VVMTDSQSAFTDVTPCKNHSLSMAHLHSEVGVKRSTAGTDVNVTIVLVSDIHGCCSNSISVVRGFLHYHVENLFH